MIQEIVIQHVQPEKRDEYVQVFGEFLAKANYRRFPRHQVFRQH